LARRRAGGKHQGRQAPSQEHKKGAKEVQKCANQRATLGVTAKEQNRGGTGDGTSIKGSVLVELMELKKQLNNLLAKSYIKPLVLFVDKKDGKLQLCIDHGALNRMTIKNNYALS
jgi:hypothetical protein